MSIALRNLEYEMRNAETIHALPFGLMLFVAGYAAVKGWLGSAIWILLFNVPFNVYSTMLQRNNRIELRKLMCRQFPVPANAAGGAAPSH